MSESRSNLWGGYTAYSYQSDHTSPPLAAQLDRVPGAALTWPDDVEAKAAELRATGPVVSVHDHLSSRPLDPSDFAAYRRSGREVTPYEGLAACDVDVFFDGGPAAVSMIRSHTPFDWDDTVSDLGMRLADWAHQDLVSPVLRLADVDRVRTSGEVGVVLTLESCSPIGNDVDRLDVLFGLGVRLMGLVYSESNLLGSGLADVTDAGLTRLGKWAVRRMNELGMIVDVSHAADATCLDAARTSQAPVVVTHAGARGLWPTPRMKPDDVIRACADTGGYIGIEAAPHTTITRDHPRHSLESVMRHVEYCIDLVGIDHVALGPDTNFGDHTAWHREFAAMFGKDAGAAGTPPYEPVAYVAGVENPREAAGNMIRWLFAHGYTAGDVAKVAGGNALRVMRQVWPR